MIMDIYLCSTVRHLLFSLLRSLSNGGQQSHIFFICDQQNVNKENYNCECLPQNISISFIKRKDIKKKLTGTINGTFVKIIAHFNIKTSAFLREKIKSLVFGKIIEFHNGDINLDSTQLYLFNDRNKISRLFRLAFKDYSIIEDGISNYRGKNFSFFEKAKVILLHCEQNMRYFGDDYRCKKIYLLKPNEAPEDLKAKVHAINFIRPEDIHRYCYNFFKVKPLNKSYSHILATQPISIAQFSNSNYDLLTYQKILSILRAQNTDIAFKVHPKEDIRRYREKFPDIDFIESKIPLELIILSNKVPCNIISMYSAAGMGFEDYCSRITLIYDNEVEKMNDLLSDWKINPNHIDARIKKVLVKHI